MELLKRGADPNGERGSGDSTPLHLAIVQGKLDLVDELLKKRAHLEAKDHNGSTPLLEAIKFDASGTIIDLLLEKGVYVHALIEDRAQNSSCTCLNR